MQPQNRTRRGVTTALAIALTTAIGITASSPAEAADVTRLGGQDRIATGLQVFEKNRDVFTGTTAVVAGIGGFADALTASPLAAAYKGPVLSTAAGNIDPRVVASLKAQGITKVVVMGGAGAVSNTALATLKNAGITVERLGGADRYQTAALAAARAMEVRGATSVPVFVADGSGFGDALSAGSAAVHEGGVVILSRNGVLGSAEKAFLKDNASSVVAIGGAAAKAVKAAGIKHEAISGSDRYDTAAKVAARFFPNADEVVLASGEGYGDAVSGSPLAALSGAPLLLTRGAALPAPAATYLAATNADITILGGTGVVAPAVATKAEAVADAGDVNATKPNQPTATPTPTATPKPTATTTPSPGTGATGGVIGPVNTTPSGNATGSHTVRSSAGQNTDLTAITLGSQTAIAGPVTAKPTKTQSPGVSIETFSSGGIVFGKPKLTEAVSSFDPGTYTYDLMNGATKVGTYTLKIENAPAVSGISGDGETALNGVMTLKAEGATGGNLKYEWLKATAEQGPYSTVVATTTEPTFSKTFSDADAGWYKVRVSNSVSPAATSNGFVQVFKSSSVASAKATQVVFDANTLTGLKVGESHTISGTVKESATDGAAVSNATVSVTFQGKTVKSGPTEGNGKFSVDVTPSIAGNSQTATASFGGDATHTGSSASSSAFAVAQGQAAVTLTAPSNGTTVNSNTDVTVEGRLTGIGGPGTVEFYDYAAAGAGGVTPASGGTKLGSVVTDADGNYSGKVQFTVSGNRVLVARFTATANAKAANSDAVAVTVNP